MAAQTKAHGITLPTSTIQGREFFWVVIQAGVDLETNYDVIGSNFQKLVTAVQQVAEMHVIGYPNGNDVIMALSWNTTPGAPDSGVWMDSNVPALETAIDESTGWSVSVYDAKLSGSSFNWD